MQPQNVGKVISFTNIDAEDFTHKWGGQPFFVKAGETVMFPYDLAEHLAKHLARKILLRTDKSSTVYDPKDPSGGTGQRIWTVEDEQQLVKRILGTAIQQEVPREKTEVEILNEKVDALQKQFPEITQQPATKPAVSVPAPTASEEGNVKASTPPPVVAKPTDDKSVVVSPTYTDKAEVIAALKAKGVTFDARLGKDKLQLLLKE